MESKEKFSSTVQEQTENNENVFNSENSETHVQEEFDPEKAKRKQNLAKFTRFLDDDLAVKKSCSKLRQAKWTNTIKVP